MDKSKKILISILVDILLLAVVVYSVKQLLSGVADTKRNFCMAIIALCIPVGFLLTFYSVAWEKFDEEEIGDTGDVDDTEDKSPNTENIVTSSKDEKI